MRASHTVQILSASLLSLSCVGGASGDLRLLYQFDADEAVPADASGNDVQATLSGPTWVANGYEGGCYEFDGVDDFMRVELDLDVWMHAMPQVSFGAWARLDASDNFVYQVISTDDGGCDRSLAADRRADGTMRWSGFPGYCPIDDGPEAQLGKWTFLCVVYDRFEQTMRVHVDDQSFELPATNGPSLSFFDIGRNPSFAEFFDGAIDNVFVYEGVLSEEQVELIRVGGSVAILEVEADNSERERFERDGFSKDPTAEDVILYPAVLAARDGAVAPDWAFTSVDPGASWEQPGFDDGSWAVGPGGFATAGHRWERDVVGSPWDEADVWARSEFVLTADDLESVDGYPIALWGRWDDLMTVYINGELAVDRFGDFTYSGAGVYADYRYVPMSDAAMASLEVGQNVIAMRGTNFGGGAFLDLGVVRNLFDGMPQQGFSSLPQLYPVLQAARRHAAKHHIPSLSYAIVNEDTTYANMSIGYMDKAQTAPTPRDAYYRSASLAKPPARAAFFRLIELGVLDPSTGQPLTLDSKFWPIMEALGVSPLDGVTPDPLSAEVTLGMMIRHTSGTPDFDYNAAASEFGTGFGSLEQARVVLSSAWLDVPCDPGPLEWWCTGGIPEPSCYRYSNTANFLMRYMVELLTGDYEEFLEQEVVQAEAAGFDRLRIWRERLADRHPREPWSRTWQWPYDRWHFTDEWLSHIVTAEGYAQLARQRMLFWGQPMPDFIPCHSGYPAKGGWTDGTHTIAAQSLAGDNFNAFVILTNEHGQLTFGPLYNQFGQAVENLRDTNGWGCPQDINGTGTIDSDDLGALLSAFGSTAAADIDGDGDTDSDDLGLLLAAFGQDCI